MERIQPKMASQMSHKTSHEAWECFCNITTNMFAEIHFFQFCIGQNRAPKFGIVNLTNAIYASKYWEPLPHTQHAQRYDMIEEFNVDSKAEYTA